MSANLCFLLNPFVFLALAYSAVEGGRGKGRLKGSGGVIGSGHWLGGIRLLD